MMAPDREAEHCDDDHRTDDVLGAMQWASGKSRYDVSDYPEGREQDDVDFRVSEEPEDIVPEERSTLNRREVYCAKCSVDIQENDSSQKRWECIEHHEDRDQYCPRKCGHESQLQPWRSHLEHRNKEINGTHRYRDGHQYQSTGSQVESDGRSKQCRSLRRI